VSAADALADRLAARTLQLVNVPSVSRDERAISELVASLLPDGMDVLAHEEALLATPRRRAGGPSVVLAGHLDTVPPQGNLPGRIADDVVWGLGASDMKGGLAVMLELARELAASDDEPDLDLSFLFFPREEVSSDENPLPDLFERWPALSEAALAILLEPTDCEIHAGCLGHLHARVVVEGRSAHSARPWLGVNAIDLALARLSPLAGFPPREVELDGLTFVEVLSLTGIQGGIAANVIPDRAEATLSYRYAPDRTPEEAERELRRLVGEVEILGNSPPGKVVARAPLVERLRGAAATTVQPKQAWTNVADFTSRGIDAINFGPGATRTVHAPDEHVPVAALVRAYSALRRFAGGSV
jgi:succinyl-diaminopimelate desuccinylase